MSPSSQICALCRQRLRQLVLGAPARARFRRDQARGFGSRSPAHAAKGPASAQVAHPSFATQRISSRSPWSYSKSPVLFTTQPFGSSSSQRAAVLNPKQDEDGNEMIVEITPRAAHRLKQIMTTDENPDLALRITVESGGCHGFQYLMSLTDMSQVSQDEDTVFQGDEGSRIVLDEPSLELLKGSKVDYTMELIGSQFKIVDNPHATSSCGCGTSFDINV